MLIVPWNHEESWIESRNWGAHAIRGTLFERSVTTGRTSSGVYPTSIKLPGDRVRVYCGNVWKKDRPSHLERIPHGITLVLQRELLGTAERNQ